LNENCCTEFAEFPDEDKSLNKERKKQKEEQERTPKKHKSKERKKKFGKKKRKKDKQRTETRRIYGTKDFFKYEIIPQRRWN